MFGLKNILLICATNCVISENTDNINNIQVTAPGQCIKTNKVIKVFTIIGQKQCVRKCLRNGQCQSVNYRRQQLNCELIAAKFGDSETSLILDSECDYIEMENQPKGLAGSCKSTSCKGQCSALSSGKTACIQDRCKEGWVQFQSKCYLSCNTRDRTWSEAASVCQGFDSILAEPRTEAESKFLINEAKGLGGNFWIGISDIAEEGRWEYSSDQQVVTINEFFPGQPDGNRIENCIILYEEFNEQWGDFGCSQDVISSVKQM